MEDNKTSENNIRDVNISLSENIIEIINKIGKEKSFKDNLIKILKKLIQLRIKDMNEKILVNHENYLKDKAKISETIDYSIINQNKNNYMDEIKKLIKIRKGYTLLFQDLQKLIQGNLTQNEFTNHKGKYPIPAKRLSIII